MSRLLLVDCDGTIRETISGKPFIEDPLDQKAIKGAGTALYYYQDTGWTIVGISNQGGVAAGHKTLGAAIEEQRKTLELLPQLNAILICPDFEGRFCWLIKPEKPHFAIHCDNGPGTGNTGIGLTGAYRKPRPGMLIAAMRMFADEKSAKNYWYVGDREEDRLAAAAAGLNFCDAETWRNRFKPGMHKVDATPEMIEFLEGIKLQP